MNLLSIGGSDPSGGAGIQSDVKTFSELGVYGLTVITAITGQNTMMFGQVQAVSRKMLEVQMKSMIADFEISGIKISMVYDSSIITTVFDLLKDIKVPIVVDPVIKSTTGGTLLKETAVEKFKKFIVPLATVITPNKFEAEYLTGIRINSIVDLHNAAKRLQRLGAKNVVITGIEKKDKVIDFLFTKNTKHEEATKKISSINHGSGCNYSAALIYSLAENMPIKNAVRFAKKYSYNSIKHAKKIGRGFSITQHKEQDELVSILKQTIIQFTMMKNAYKAIPECQTNFVFSKTNPNSIKDIVGVAGRIVKTKKELEVVGNLEYGGSKHVATALLTVNKKFPEILSAVNLKYERQIISNLKKKKFVILSYDRMKEPKKIRTREGFSIRWGMSKAINNTDTPPDLIYHKGDFGKEAMMVIFGRTPFEVIKKIKTVVRHM